LSILANEVFAEAAGRSIARPLLSSADAPQIVESTIGREWHSMLEVTIIDGRTSKPMPGISIAANTHHPILVSEQQNQQGNTERTFTNFESSGHTDQQGKTNLKIAYPEDTYLSCRVSVQSKEDGHYDGFDFSHEITVADLKTGKLRWVLPLDVVTRKTKLVAVNQFTGQPIAHVLIGIRKDKAPGFRETDDNGVVILRGTEVGTKLFCEQFPVADGVRVNVMEHDTVVTEDDIKNGTITMRIAPPKVSLRVATVLEEDGKRIPLTDKDGYVDARPYSYNLGFIHNGVAWFTDLTPGDYQLRMLSRKNPDKYDTVSPKIVTIDKEGKTQDVTLVVKLAEDYRGKLQGVVVGPDGSISDAALKLNSTNGKFTKSLTSDIHGQFAFDDVPGGKLSLSVSKPHCNRSRRIAVFEPIMRVSQ